MENKPPDTPGTGPDRPAANAADDTAPPHDDHAAHDSTRADDHAAHDHDDHAAHDSARADDAARDEARIAERADGGAAQAGAPTPVLDSETSRYFADSEATDPGVPDASYRFDAPLCGRDAELGRLTGALERAVRDRTLAFTVIIGEPGLGKSRLLHALCARAIRDYPGARALRASADEAEISFSAFARLLARRFGIAPGSPAAQRRRAIGEGVSEVMPESRRAEVAHLLAHLMRTPYPDSPVVIPLAESPQRLETRTFMALRRFLAADAERGPLVLCLDDLDRAGPRTINLLHYLAAGLAGSPVMLVASARELLFQRYPSFGDSDAPLERIDLAPLSDAEIESLLAGLCRDALVGAGHAGPASGARAPTSGQTAQHPARLPLRLPARLSDHAHRLGGSPRAICELVRLLLEVRVIVRDADNRWSVDPARLAATRLPGSYEELVAERLAVLAPRERKLLEHAAIIGETFWLDAVVALVRTSALKASEPDGPTLADIAASGASARNRVARALAQLVDRDWIEAAQESSVPGEREYRFANPNLHKLVLGGITDVRQRRYHKIVAQWLELRPDSRAAVAQEDIAAHLERAGEPAAAAGCYRRAADSAREGFQGDRAIALYRRALACMGESDLAARIHLWHDLGAVYELRGDFEDALGAYERMLRLAWVCASRTQAAIAFNEMGRVWRRKGDLRLALEYLERGRELFEQASDARGIAGSLDDIGNVLYLLGHYDEAFEQVTAALEILGGGGDTRSIADSLTSLGNIQKARGRFDEARGCHVEALGLRERVGDRWGVVVSRNNLAVVDYERGDFAAARAGWKAALADAEAIGAMPVAARALSNLGELALSEGHPEEAQRRLDEARAIAEDIDDRQLLCEALRNLAVLASTQGRFARARELAARGHEIAADNGLRDAEGRALICLGEVASAGLYDAGAVDAAAGADGDSPGDYAEPHFAAGVELLRAIGNESDLARGLESYGRFKLERGDPTTGKDLLREALVIYSKLGMTRGDGVQKILASL